MTSRRLLAILLALVAVTSVACKKSTSTSPTDRPSTTARIRIASPEQDAKTGPNVHIVIELIGGKLVPLGSTKLVPDGGHIHVSVDGKVTSMTAGLEQDVNGLAPGHHIISAEFVAADHLPFSPKKVAAVTLEVQQQ